MLRTALLPALRRTGGGLIRRWGLLPAGDPDGLGDDETLRGQSLPMTVLVYFPDTVNNLYQLRQWYGPLLELDRRHRVGVVCQDSRTARAVRAECALPVVCCGRIATLEDMVSRSDVALALYVNHNVRNLLPLRFTGMLHAYLGHGESDKVSSASNQVKAYDFVLVAGDAGRDRLRRNLMRYDVDRHVRTVGRPQLDCADPPADGTSAASPFAASPFAASPFAASPFGDTGDRPTVLYAPTWEGAQPSMAYSSVVSHGPALLRSLLDAGTYRVVYRPHSRTGANDHRYSAADQELRAVIGRYRSTDPEARHAVDLSPAWSAHRDPADVLISDISAVAADWMATGRPIIVTVPVSADASVDGDTVLTAVPGLLAADAAGAAEMVGRELADSGTAGGASAGSATAAGATAGSATAGSAARRAEWIRYTMGDTTPGASMARFLRVCDDLVELRGTELASLGAGRPGAG